MQKASEYYLLLKDLTKNEILRYAKQRCKHRVQYLQHPNCLKEKISYKQRIGYLDIETSNLSADFGFIFSYCILGNDNKMVAKSVVKEDFDKVLKYTAAEIEKKKLGYDRRLMGELCEDMRQYDRVVTYYGKKFDIPYLRTRCSYYGLDFPLFGEVMHTDCIEILWRKFKLHRNRLETACQFFGIPAKGHRLDPHVWQTACAGKEKSINYILEHNKEDVISLKKLYEKVSGYEKEKNTSI